MSDDLRLTTNPSCLTILDLYALKIIFVATYTVNISSCLTLKFAQALIPGIESIKNGDCLSFSRIGMVINSAISDYLIRNISSTYYRFSTVEEIYLKLLLTHQYDLQLYVDTLLTIFFVVN